MRLINTATGEFAEFFDPSTTPLYAILSHTWEQPPKREQSYQEVVKIQERLGLSVRDHCQPERRTDDQSLPPSIWDSGSALSEKVRKACDIARRDGYEYIWIDSCCIDKTSSSELSEAINSMFNWYRGAEVCYAYLSDVSSGGDMVSEGSGIRESRWFKRSWTLQELVAPRIVIFLSRDWKVLGTKESLAELIEDITHIDRKILMDEKVLADETVAQRMLWTASREATRVEDKAYSLLGIFGITMPTLYGEGEHAFQRLQEEILQRIPDQSLFAWGSSLRRFPLVSQESSNIRVIALVHDSPFAPSPHSFNLSNIHITHASGPEYESLKLPIEEYTPTPYGIRTRLCLLPLQTLSPNISILGLEGVDKWYLSIFSSQASSDPRRLLSRLCYVTSVKSGVELLHVPQEDKHFGMGLQDSESIIFTVSLDDLIRAQNSGLLQIRTVYLPRPETFSTTTKLRPKIEGHTTGFGLFLPTPARLALQLRGYTVSDLRTTMHHSQSGFSLTLSNTTWRFKIHIHYRHMQLIAQSRSDDMSTTAMILEARAWILSSDSDGERPQNDTAPFASALWSDCPPWHVTFPPRTIRLVTHSGEEVTLRLELAVAASSHYHINVVPSRIAGETFDSSAGALLKTWRIYAPAMKEPHTPGLTLTMLGSVRQELETRGYSVLLHQNPTTNSHHSISLLISDIDHPEFIVSINYFHMLRMNSGEQQELLVAARVTLIMSPSVPEPCKIKHQDGPYVVVWEDYNTDQGWRWSQRRRRVDLALPTGGFLSLYLGLDLAWRSEYYLVIDIERNGDSFPALADVNLKDDEEPWLPLMLREPHGSVNLVLPGHVKRALLEQGYHVHFEGPNENHPHPYHLTLSDAVLTIDIEYSYRLSTGPDGQQGLTFQALAKALSSQTLSQEVAGIPTPDGSCDKIVTWDARNHATRRVRFQDATSIEEGWRWNLPIEPFEFTLPTGVKLTLRLGFYLVWLGEYCLTVEVIPPSPSSQPESHESPETSYFGVDSVEEPPDDRSRQEMVTGADETGHQCIVALELEALVPFGRIYERRRGVGGR
ncbi:hypothetical protein V8D89_001030 [Ganoderma adspersum]